MINKWDGDNSMLRSMESVSKKYPIVMPDDPILKGDICDKCRRHTVVNEFICLKTNTALTVYCKQSGGPGCIFGRIGQCQGTKMIKVCQRKKCGSINNS